jgi:hypothetical protein
VLATQSKPIHYEVLKLAETVQTKKRMTLSQPDMTDFAHPESSLEAAHTAISIVFRLLEEVTLDLTCFWDTEGEIHNGHTIETFLEQLDVIGGCPVAETTYWLASRLGT